MFGRWLERQDLMLLGLLLLGEWQAVPGEKQILLLVGEKQILLVGEKQILLLMGDILAILLSERRDSRPAALSRSSE